MKGERTRNLPNESRRYLRLGMTWWKRQIYVSLSTGITLHIAEGWTREGGNGCRPSGMQISSTSSILLRLLPIPVRRARSWKRSQSIHSACRYGRVLCKRWTFTQPWSSRQAFRSKSTPDRHVSSRCSSCRLEKDCYVRLHMKPASTVWDPEWQVCTSIML